MNHETCIAQIVARNFVCTWKSKAKFYLHVAWAFDNFRSWMLKWAAGRAQVICCIACLHHGSSAESWSNASAVIVVAEKIWKSQNMLSLPFSSRMSSLLCMKLEEKIQPLHIFSFQINKHGWCYGAAYANTLWFIWSIARTFVSCLLL